MAFFVSININRARKPVPVRAGRLLLEPDYFLALFCLRRLAMEFLRKAMKDLEFIRQADPEGYQELNDRIHQAARLWTELTKRQRLKLQSAQRREGFTKRSAEKSKGLMEELLFIRDADPSKYMDLLESIYGKAGILPFLSHRQKASLKLCSRGKGGEE